MSEEMKAGVLNATLQGAPTGENNEDSAKAAAEAEAKARRQEERRKRLEGVKAERLKQEEESGRRQESDDAKRAAREKKMAQLAYAENYRQKLKDDQERRRALRNSKKKDTAAEDTQNSLKQAEDEALLDAKKRNERNAELLDKFNEKQKADSLLAEELKNAPKAERKPYQMTSDGPMFLTEDGKELIAATPAKKKEDTFSGIDLSILEGLGGALSSEGGMSPKPEKEEAQPTAIEEPAEEEADEADDFNPTLEGIDLSALEGIGGNLSSENALSASNDRDSKDSATPADTDAVAEDAPKAEDNTTNETDDANAPAINDKKETDEQPVAEEPVAEEPVAEESVAEEHVAEESVAEEPVAEEPVAEEPVAEEPVAEEPVVEESVAEEPVAEESVAEEPVAKESVAEEPIAEEPVAEEPVAPAPAPKVIDSKLAALLAGLGTYELVTTKADFGEEFSKKKAEIEEILAPANEEYDAASVSYTEPENLEYDAGFVYTYDALGLVDKKKAKQESKELKRQKKKEAKLIALGLLPPKVPTVFDDPEYLATLEEPESNGNAAVAIGATALTAAAVGHAIASSDYTDTDRELDELKKKKQALENAINQQEEADADELRNLRGAEHGAIMGLYAADKKAADDALKAQKEAYEKEIAELEARRNQMQKEHEERKRELEENISAYSLMNGNEASYRAPYDNAPSEITTSDGDGIISISYAAPDGNVYSEKEIEEFSDFNEKNALALTANASLTGAHVERLNKREFNKYLRKSTKNEEKLIKQDKKLERKRGDERAVLAERLGVRRILLESYIADLNYSILAGSSKYTKKYDRLVSEATGEYNGLLDSFADKTGTNPPRVDERISDRIISGEGTPLIPIINYELTSSIKGRKLTSEEKKRYRREQLDYLKLDKEIRRDTENGENTSLEPATIAVTDGEVKNMIKLDNECVAERIAYRTGTIKYELTLAQFHFDENTKAKKRRRAKSSANLRAMNRDAKKLIKQTKKSNKRYAMVMKGVDCSNVKSAAERARLDLLRQRIIALCTERNEIDKRLISLYRDNGKGKGKKNVRNKIAKLRLASSIHMFNKLVPYYKKTKKYNINRSIKEEIWGLMNQHIDLKAYLQECNYRKKHERPKGEARRWLNNEIRDTKRNIEFVRQDLEKLMYKAKAKDEKQPKIKVQLFFTLILALVLVSIAAIISFSSEIAAAITEMFSGLFGK